MTESTNLQSPLKYFVQPRFVYTFIIDLTTRLLTAINISPPSARVLESFKFVFGVARALVLSVAHLSTFVTLGHPLTGLIDIVNGLPEHNYCLLGLILGV